jgi:DNA-binding transcriptional MerR regulator
MNERGTLRVQEFARLAGVTVRALHIYDAAGLLTPPARTARGHRRYRLADLLRLQQIITLKHLGFSLDEIKAMLAAPAYSLRAALAAQKAALEDEIHRLQGAAFALGRTLETLDDAGRADWAEVTAAIRGLREADRDEWLARFYPPEQRAWLMERAAHTPAPLLEEAARAWAEVYADFAALRHLPPQAPAVRAVAARMERLVGLFSGGDGAVERGVAAIWGDPAQAARMPPGPWSDPELRAFAFAALEHHRAQRGAD